MDPEPLDLRLLPASAAVVDGRLQVGGVDVADLAERFGTPLYVYDEAELETRCRAYAAGLGADRVAYAGKAFLCVAMARLVDRAGLALDVASGGELHVALHAGFPPERLVFHGNEKSTEELRAALAAGVGRIVVDSYDEIDRLVALAPHPEPGPRVLVRVTPGVEAHTHEYIETGTEDSKFGFTVNGGYALDAIRRVVEEPGLRFGGLHCHIGSQIDLRAPFARTGEVLAELVVTVRRELGADVPEVTIGGGLGVPYVARDLDTFPGIEAFTAALLDDWRTACAAAGLPEALPLTVEPGRSIAAPAGLTLYRVGTIKAIPGGRTYAAVDGGMSDNPRPALYGARYEVFVPARADAPRPRVVSLAGKHCEQGDVLVTDASVPADLAVGDVVATPVTGAYAYSMASNYNRLPRPAVVFVRDGDARVVVRRETLDDLVRLDV